jgi:1-acyl-sn-glycerol-3-phosphate acyltransferase
MDIFKSIIVWITGIFFIVITFPITLIIWIFTFPFDRDRAIIHWLLMYESLILVHLLPIWKIRIEGREKAKKNTTYVVISNHQSLLDILLMNCLLYRYKWISKIENMKMPVIGWYLRMADYITVDRGNDESKTLMLESSLNCLNRKISIMIFPEGTRSLNRDLGFFKRGAFQLALEAGVPILPVLIDGSGSVLPKNGLIFGNKYKIRIRVLDPVLPSEFGTDIPEELALKLSSLMTSELKILRSES